MLHKASQAAACGCSDPTTESEDERSQRAVLALVLAQHPSQLTVYEIVREAGEDSDAAERALRDLVGVGLLRREGASVLPTRPALHFERLTEAGL
jgi:predicted transcriptional regulator